MNPTKDSLFIPEDSSKLINMFDNKAGTVLNYRLFSTLNAPLNLVCNKQLLKSLIKREGLLLADESMMDQNSPLFLSPVIPSGWLCSPQVPL